jgi:xanthine dehydrogenase accessory factor
MTTPLVIATRAPYSHAAAPAGTWLRPLRGSWPRAVCRLLASNAAVVRVVIAEVRGSAPRECGACMLVSQADVEGTIGGGNLEWRATQAARSLLAAGGGESTVRLSRLVLGRELAQCCGGVVQLWLERFTPADVPLLTRAAEACAAGTAALLTEFSGAQVARRLLPGLAERRLQFRSTGSAAARLLEPLAGAPPVLWLYGAGHVGQALIRLLSELPFDITWVDGRPGLIPAPLPDNVQPLAARAPTQTVERAPAGARFLVMTHDHALDYALCRRILERGDFSWLGLIGSASKAARFRSRLRRDGLARESIVRLVCPIGVAGVECKWPAAIAVGVAAQLLQGLESSARSPGIGLATDSAAQALVADCGATDCAGCRSSPA